jgi:hypothetical protein
MVHVPSPENHFHFFRSTRLEQYKIKDTDFKNRFVAAIEKDSKDSELNYSLFRTYDRTNNPALINGPDPRKVKISDAFAATCATKYLFHPWEVSLHNTTIKFADMEFPYPHNVTELALKEAWDIYGPKVPLSVVVNIGPGLPSIKDLERLTRKFSFGNRTVDQPRKTRALATAAPADHNQTPPSSRSRSRSQKSPGRERHRLPRPTFGRALNKEMERNMRDRETEIEDEIKDMLREAYPDENELYFRLAPDTAPEKTTVNDCSHAERIVKETKVYLDESIVRDSMELVAMRIPSVAGV